MRLHFWSFLSVLCLLSAVACKSEGGGTTGGTTTSKKAGDSTLVIHQLGDADKLNPITSSSANSTYIEGDLFQGLLTIDPKSLQMEGLLATGRPQIQEINEGEYKGGMSLTYEIRPEATWDNGQPITAADVIFTTKSVLCPIVESSSLKSYVEFIDNIVADAGNPKRFTIFSKQRYLLAETYGTGFIIPQYHYDPKGLLNGFTIAQLKDPAQAQALTANANIKQFAEAFNTKFDREKGTIVGSGPYAFVAWETGQTITLRRKTNWWGDKVKDVPQLAGNPSQITYKVVTDWTTAVASMKDEGLDVAYGINTPDFVELQKNASFKQLFNLHTPTQISYDYIGFNMRNPKLQDKRVRRALAHLIDKKEIIDVLLYGLGETVNSPIHPIKPHYNKNLPDIPFDVEKAKALLTEAGWTDTDGDGVVDKEINGQRVPLSLTIKYNNGNERRKNYALLLQENARRAGVQIEVLAREWTVFLDEAKRRDFEMVCLGWVQSPTPDDLKQIWHTESNTPDGSNYTSFGTPETDKIIDEIRVTLDEQRRNELYMQIQQIIYDEQPYIFLVSPKERIAIHGRFANADATIARPGYGEKAFVLKAQPQPL